MGGYWNQRRHRSGGDGRSERVESARQRTVVLTFESPESAQAWDDAGQPVHIPAAWGRSDSGMFAKNYNTPEVT